MNKVIQCGYVATEPEVSATESGIHIAKFRIAVQRRFANAQGVRESDFFTVVAWRQNADFVGKYIRKGRKVLVEGELQNNNYTAQDGSKHYHEQIVATNIEFADSKPAAEDNNEQPQKPTPQNPPEGDFTEVEDDELPF